LIIISSYVFIRIFRPVLLKNDRGKWLFTTIGELGLVDIEQRIPTETNVPPLNTLKLATNEIVISGFSCQSTLRNFENFIEEIIKNIKVKILILHKERNESNIRERFPKDADAIINSIEDAITLITTKKWIQERNFELKYLAEIPPFTAIMIDGDIEWDGRGKPHDDKGIIRIQPLTCYEEKNQGLILSFSKNKSKNKKIFDYFASDFRKQWKNAIN
jgi:hypothetical protein